MSGNTKMMRSGTAKVVSCNSRAWGWSIKDMHGRSISKFHLILDVYPDGAEPFRTETSKWFNNMRFPNPGDSLRVLCNPEKKKVKIDLSEDERFNTRLFRPVNDARRKRERDQTLNDPVGTPAAGDYDKTDHDLT
jgi:hypothetical protein